MRALWLVNQLWFILQLDGSLSVSIAFDGWLGASPLANYQPIETSSLPSNC